jgi:hypothetical protein
MSALEWIGFFIGDAIGVVLGIAAAEWVSWKLFRR